jgi:hypothetical protein
MSDDDEKEGEFTREMYDAYIAKLKERLSRPESLLEWCADGKIRHKKRFVQVHKTMN